MTAARTPTRALAALALAVTLVAALTPAAAQEAAPSLEVVLTGISTVVGPRAPLDYQVTVRNRGQEPVRDLLVQARLGSQVDTRSELATVLAIPAGDVGG
ncbi:MAG TPA: hypothetical protein VIJ05_04625, partial [Actinomycetes bacterium]